ncbi:MAG: zinc ribbon domain-containing protein [Oscillospiraceae bacterium]
MKKKCDYCGGFIDDTAETCPNCGAVNEHVIRSANGVPKTIEELLAFCDEKKLPLEEMRFFIGVDYRKSKAFGIYKDDNGDFIVYKNKGNGDRAVRYRGKDEAYAVNEIYQKLKSEIQLRREKNAAAVRSQSKKENEAREKRSMLIKDIIGIVLIVAWFSFIIFGSFGRPDDGYYRYNDDYYYYQDSTWYLFDDIADSWVEAMVIDEALSENFSDYYESGDYNAEYNIDDFSDTDYYKEYSSNSDYGSDYNDDWDDDDWDWGGDDWDIGDTDWDTDW